MRKNLASFILLGILGIIFYLVFGLYIVQGESNLNSLVEGYEADYSETDTNQAKGLDLIKSNWNRVWGDKKLMQRQVDKSEVSE